MDNNQQRQHPSFKFCSNVQEGPGKGRNGRSQTGTCRSHAGGLPKHWTSASDKPRLEDAIEENYFIKNLLD